MRTYDFAPLFRSTIGFDRLLNMLDDGGARPGWPPYNIEKSGDDRYRITMAVAGFTPDEIEVVQQGPTLIVSSQRAPDRAAPEMLHHGLALRNFRQTFNLADHVKVATASLEHGLLWIDLVREVPEELKPRHIRIGSQASTPVSLQARQPRLANQDSSERPAKAA